MPTSPLEGGPATRIAPLMQTAVGPGQRRALARALGACVGAWLALGAQPLGAQTRPARDTAVIPLDAVVVSTARAATTTGGTSALVVAPDSLALAPAPTLEQVLRSLPFVTVRENSRGEAEISVRGSESRTVAVLLDGVPLTLGWDHRTDASLVPAAGVQQLVLVRGLHSVLHGPNVLGGVVELGVAHGPLPPGPGVRLRASVDQLGSHGLGAVVSRSAALAGGDLLVRAGVGLRARPAVPLPSGVADPEDAGAGRRANSDVRQHDGFLALRYQDAGGAWLGLSGSAFRAERGVPPELHLARPRLWRYPDVSRALGVLSAGTGQRRTRLGVGDVEAGVGVQLGSAEIHSFADRAYARVVGTEESDDRTLTLRLLGDHSVGERGSVRGAFTLADVRHDERVDGGAALAFRQRLWSLGAEATAPLPGGARWSGGVVLDGADTPEAGDKPPLDPLWAWGARLGASGLALDGRLRLHAALNRRARFPSLRELYSGSLGRFVPNPELRPERLLGVEAGGTARAGALELQAVAFHNRLRDAIVRAGHGDGRFRRENRDEIRSTGLELLGDWRLGALSLAGDVMLQRVRVLDPGAPADARRAEHQPELRGGLGAELELPLRVRARVGTLYTGRQFCVHPELAREVELPGSGRLDLGVEREWRLGPGAGPFRSLLAGLALDNATDSAAHDQCGLPQPGRTVRVVAELR